jgi:DNA-binding NarL/FixJ family response regulator
VDIAELFYRSTQPMLVADDDRCLVDANHAALLLLRCTRRDLLRLRVDDLLEEDVRARLDELWRRFLTRGASTSTHELVRPFARPGSRPVTVEVAGVAHAGPDRHLAVCTPVRRVEEPRFGRVDGRLSDREREVLRMVAQGADGPAIAAELVLSPATVRTHVNNAMRKLGARTRAHAVTLAIQRGDVDV